jgi:hypothetical protein
MNRGCTLGLLLGPVLSTMKPNHVFLKVNSEEDFTPSQS